ncbi:hypothetical protein [Ensifer sp. MJa1]|uniref:hypothetical protein n=1 Tax=Ensifer sp. MJa1 TaxID=2919888 RepID=UPI00300A94AD
MCRSPIAGFVAILVIAGAAHAEEALFDHNGSRMAIDYDRGAIIYRTVKSSLRNFVKPGLVAFSGEIERRGAIRGTAFTFRNGCDAAGYAVSGRYDPALPGYVLTGAAPVREKGGCRVTGYSLDTPNARLEFIDLAPEDIGAAQTTDAAMDTAPRPRQPAPRN